MFFLTHVSKKDGKMRVHNKNEKSRVQDMKLYTESNMKNFTGRKEYLK